MAVTSFKEIADGRGGGEAYQERRGIRRHVRVWLVKTDSPTDDETTVLAHASCPDIGDVHPNDSDAYCRELSCDQHKGKLAWKVTASYSTEKELSDNPLNDPAEIEWSTESRQRPFWKDRNGSAILNSAGDYYDPPVEGDDSRWVAEVTKNVSAVPSWLLLYRDAVNSDEFELDGLTITPGQAKMSRIAISKWQERNDIAYRELRMNIALNDDGWAAEPLDQGFRERVTCATDCGSAAGSGSGCGSGSGSGDELAGRRHILDTNCEPVTSPVPLDGLGCALACPTPDSAVFRTHHIYHAKAFSSLPLT